MNRAAVGSLWVVAFFSVIEAMRARRALGVIALEGMERVFNVVENVFHLG
jgi:hypothetical protein